MKKIILGFALASLFASTSFAQEAQEAERTRPSREELVRRFDQDQDGKLDRDERQAARQEMREHRQGRRPGPRQEIEQRADEDGDGQLDRRERRGVRRHVRQQRGQAGKRGELRQGRRELRRDRAEIRRDRRELRRDVRQGDRGELRRDRRELRRDKQELRQDRRELRRDRVDRGEGRRPARARGRQRS